MTRSTGVSAVGSVCPTPERMLPRHGSNPPLSPTTIARLVIALLRGRKLGRGHRFPTLWVAYVTVRRWFIGSSPIGLEPMGTSHPPPPRENKTQEPSIRLYRVRVCSGRETIIHARVKIGFMLSKIYATCRTSCRWV